jgi:hypothetical protein
MSPEAVEHIAGLVRTLREIVALPNLAAGTGRRIFATLTALFEQRTVNLGIVHLYGDDSVAELLLAVFEIVALPGFVLNEGFLAVYFAFFKTFLAVVDLPGFAPPPIFLHLLSSAHFALISEPSQEIVGTIFEVLALVGKELPALRALDPERTLALCLAVVRYGLTPVRVLPRGYWEVLVALLRCEKDFVTGAIAELGIDDSSNWRDALERLSNPLGDVEQDGMFAALEIPLRMLFDRIESTAAMLDLDDRD